GDRSAVADTGCDPPALEPRRTRSVHEERPVVTGCEARGTGTKRAVEDPRQCQGRRNRAGEQQRRNTAAATGAQSLPRNRRHTQTRRIGSETRGLEELGSFTVKLIGYF